MPAKKKAKVRAIFIQTNRGLYPLSVLKSAEVGEDSKQLSSVKAYMTQNGLIEPPYSLETFLLLYESNPVLSACVNQTARDVAGLGWDLKLKEDKKEDKAEHDRAMEFLLNQPLRSLFNELVVDLCSTGFFGIEVVRNNKGQPSKLYRVPAHTLRAHISKELYCQIRGEDRVWFKAFGLDQKINSKTGKPAEDGTGSEVIYVRRPYPKSDYYGVPNFLSATGDIIGLISSRDYNINFFQNYGVPSAIVTLEGDGWGPESEAIVKKFMTTEFKGVNNAHRSLVLTQPEGCKITVDPIDIKVRESGFNVYEKICKENILVAFSMPPERIGIRAVGQLGGNVAEEATKIYISGVIEPMQEDIEEIVTKLLLEKGLGITSYVFKFKNIDPRNLDAITTRHASQIEHGVLTPNEARNELGKPPYEGGDVYYISSALIEVGQVSDELVKSYGKTKSDT